MQRTVMIAGAIIGAIITAILVRFYFGSHTATGWGDIGGSVLAAPLYCITLPIGALIGACIAYFVTLGMARRRPPQ